VRSNVGSNSSQGFIQYEPLFLLVRKFCRGRVAATSPKKDLKLCLVGAAAHPPIETAFFLGGSFLLVGAAAAHPPKMKTVVHS